MTTIIHCCLKILDLICYNEATQLKINFCLGGKMSQNITVDLQKREVIGKGLNKLRTDGVVPAVIHNHGKDSILVEGSYQDFVKVYNDAGKHHAVDLKLDNKNHLAIIKQVDFDPKKHQIRHIVFQAIKQNEKVETEVPIVLEGEIPAEKVGLLVIRHLDNVDIEALPKNLPDQVVIDASVLENIGDKIHVSDIKKIEGVTVLTEEETTVATIEETKAQMSEEATEESSETDSSESEDSTSVSSDTDK